MTVAVDKTKCIGCGACVVECPVEALDLIDGLAVVDPKKCEDHGKCALVCPTNALAVVKKPSKPSDELNTEAGSKFNLKDPLPETVKDYAQDNNKKQFELK